MNTVINNIFVKSAEEVAAVSGNMINNTCIFERNIMVSEEYPIYRTMYESPCHESAPLNITSLRNLVFDRKGKVNSIGDRVKIPLQKFKTDFGKDKYTIEADPLFVDYENNDFRLKPNSPAYDIGFVDIDFSDVGIQR